MDSEKPMNSGKYIKKISGQLEKIARRGHHQRNVFDDWVTLMLTALAGQEEAYLETVQSYPNTHERGEREADLFAEAFGRLQKAMSETDQDILGEVYEDMGLPNHENGQHFTPHPVSQMKAELGIGSDEDVGSIRDPACGSGRLLMEASKRAPNAFYFGRDNDLLCAKMAALNMCYFNLDAIIVHGNSLKLTRNRVWQTANTPLGGEIREIEPEKIADLDEAPFKQGEGSEETLSDDRRNEEKGQGSSSEQKESSCSRLEKIESEQAQLRNW